MPVACTPTCGGLFRRTGTTRNDEESVRRSCSRCTGVRPSGPYRTGPLRSRATSTPRTREAHTPPSRVRPAQRLSPCHESRDTGAAVLSIFTTARRSHLQLAFVGLLAAGCGRVGVHLLPLDRAA